MGNPALARSTDKPRGLRPVPRLEGSDLVAFLLHVAIDPAGCWLWTGGTNGANGYGKFRGLYAHRVSYATFVGPLPDSGDLDHLCRTTLCVRPTHLEPVTHRENTLRGETLAARKLAQVACIHGHPFDERNTYRPPDGTRSCRRCRADREQERRDRRKAAAQVAA